MAVHTPSVALDPAVVGLVTAAITGVVTLTLARVNGLAKREEVEASKAPDVQEHINKAVAGLIDHYTTALAQEKARHADHVQELEDKIDSLTSRLEVFSLALRAGGIPIPGEE